MSSVTIEEAHDKLKELIHNLGPGDEVLITENDRPVAKLVPAPPERPRPLPGRCKGMLTIIVEDEEHLEHFKEYMP